MSVTSLLRSALDGLSEHAAEVAAEARRRGAAAGGSDDGGLAQQLEAAAARLAAQLPAGGSTGPDPMHMLQLFDRVRRCLPVAAEVGRLLLQYQEQPQQQDAAQLELVQAAATRACAYLRCANLGGEGGAAAGQGVGSMRCR